MLYNCVVVSNITTSDCGSGAPLHRPHYTRAISHVLGCGRHVVDVGDDRSFDLPERIRSILCRRMLLRLSTRRIEEEPQFSVNFFCS